MAVRRGFHRIGMVIAVPFGIAALGALVFAAYTAITLPSPRAVRAYAPPSYQSHYFYEPASLQQIAETLTTAYNRQVSEREIHIYSLRESALSDMYGALAVAGVCAVLGLLGYLVSWALGWVIAGFKSNPT